MGIFFSVYNKFKLKHWSKLSSGKRQRVIEKIEEIQSKKLSRPKLPVVVNTKQNCSYYGSFETINGKQILNINLNLLTDPSLRFHALETVLHEGRHAYQYNVIRNKKLKFFEFKKRRWQQNYSGYITSAEDNLVYGMQPIERDAQKYAIKKMLRLKWRYKNEDDYHSTLNSMILRYDTTEQQLKDKHGIFYGLAVNKKIKNKASRKSKNL